MASSSSSIKPISLTTIHIKKSLLTHVITLAGVDKGNALCKLIYRSKAAHDEDKDFYELTCALFYKSDFGVSLDWLKAEAQLPETGHIHVTAADGNCSSAIIKDKLGLDVVSFDQMLSHAKGMHFLISNFQPKEILHHTPQVAPMEIGENSVFKNVLKGYVDQMARMREFNSWPKVDLNDNRPVFPVLFSFIGSRGVTMRIEADGTSSIVQPVSLGGMTFLGLARCLINTRDYTEIIKLAETGSNGNMDIIIRDILPEEYLTEKEIPGNIALFPMGKVVDKDLELSSMKREDVARALISLSVFTYIIGMTPLCIFTGIPQVYIGGNFMQSDTFREDIVQMQAIWAPNVASFKCLKSGHTGALGAMLSNTHLSETKA